jgi:hypothetical protein
VQRVYVAWRACAHDGHVGLRLNDTSDCFGDRTALSASFGLELTWCRKYAARGDMQDKFQESFCPDSERRIAHA